MLDPYNLTISNGSSRNAFGGSDSNATSFRSTGDDSVINVTTLENLLAGTNVTVSTGEGGSQAGNITVADPMTWSDTTLTLDAAGSIVVNAEMTATGAAGLVFKYGSGGGYSVNAPVNIAEGGSFTTWNGETESNYRIITSIDSLQGINSALGDNYVLGADIDASVTADWNNGAGFVPLGASPTAFSGTFDGLGHVVSDLVIDRSATNDVGLFGFSSGTIRNVGVTGGAVSGKSAVGGLVGLNFAGSIENAYATGAVISSDNYVGGLVGYNSAGSITNAYATGEVRSSYSYVGGLVGYNGSGGSITNAYATGEVRGNNSVGGLVGYNGGGDIRNAYATGAVTGDLSVGGLVGNKNAGSI